MFVVSGWWLVVSGWWLMFTFLLVVSGWLFASSYSLPGHA